jgi:HTH-type transcriptional regulator, sugar sensing transcriptional regulator
MEQLEGLRDILFDIGLTPLEIKVYEFLLGAGPSLAGIVSRKAGLHRRNTYDALDRLLKRGFVSYIKENNSKLFVATDPSVVLDLLDAKKAQWSKLMPQIQSMMQSWGEKKETLFFRGKNGIRHLFLDQIDVGEEVLVSATNVNCQDIISYFFPKYHLLRTEHGISMKMLFDSSVRDLPEFIQIKKQKKTQIRLTSSFNSTNVSQYIYGNTVAIITWGESPFAIVIREKAIANFYRSQFELLWKTGKKV